MNQPKTLFDPTTTTHPVSIEDLRLTLDCLSENPTVRQFVRLSRIYQEAMTNVQNNLQRSSAAPTEPNHMPTDN